MDTENIVDRFAAESVVRLADYRPPAWRVTHVELKFELGIDQTLVHSKLTLARDREEALRLDGEDVELLSARLDGRVLAPADYTIDVAGLVVQGARDGSVLEMDVRIDPARNSQLCGLYLSGRRGHGFLLTQCEAQGFRRITFFPDRPDVLARYDVTLVADKARFPVLLAGGEEAGSGDLPDGRHFARFVDPHPKPSYLFALVAGRLEKIERAYRTADGRDVSLRLWAEADAIDRCHYAMDALERAMRWDERAYGRSYDLPVFNVVATHDFNMGAMENKGLNIFNSKYLLADPDTTTDDEYRRIEAVIGHEYFHNWSGNRVTCRDWFQLSLKEGFTVFREQQFCGDMQSAALQRIDEVATLRRVQFPEDAGPLAHPVRPAEYTAIDNFYTPTVYEKGAELIRMIAGRLGAERFRRGTDLYFARHDGQAATIEDLLAALGEANDLDLSPYLAWYAQAGTPQVSASGDYDPVARTYALTLTQHTAPTPGQQDKSPLPIPVRVALFAPDGRRIPMRSHDQPERVHQECVLELVQREQRFVFVQVDARPVPSLLRGFSAPVQSHYTYAPRELALLLRHESEGYDRWNAGQQLAAAAYDALHAGAQDRSSLDAWCAALAESLEADAKQLDPALLAELLTPPSLIELGTRHEPLDPERVYLAREALENMLAGKLGARLHAGYRELHQSETGALDAPAQARRRLKGRVLVLLLRADPRAGSELAVAQYRQARSMTDRLSAMAALVRLGAPQAEEILRDFRSRYDGKPLVLDKWFALQAQVPARETLARVQALSADPAFSLHNPNRVQSLLGAFARGNPPGFNRPDGAGYRFIADKVVEIDALNPQNGARLAKAFESWHKLEPRRRAAAQAVLDELNQRAGLSRDLADVLSRMRG